MNINQEIRDSISAVTKGFSNNRDAPKTCRKCGYKLRYTLAGVLKCFKCGKEY